MAPAPFGASLGSRPPALLAACAADLASPVDWDLFSPGMLGTVAAGLSKCGWGCAPGGVASGAELPPLLALILHFHRMQEQVSSPPSPVNKSIHFVG